MKFLCDKIGLSKEACDYIYSIYNGIAKNKFLMREISEAKFAFLTNGYNSDYKEHLETISENTGIHLYSVHLVFILLCAKNAKQLYDKNGIPEEVFLETMSDIAFKVTECKKMYGIYGISTFTWYPGLMALKVFKLGRLEFEIKPCPLDGYKDYVKKNEILYSCHIPSAGPLTYESVIDSLKRAYTFFGIKDNLVVYCRSWLLYPDHYNVFPEGSNLRMFYDLFDIVGKDEDEENSNLWRIFYKEASTSVDELPGDTTLQRNFKKYLRDGNNIGVGTGILVFDGERIINK